MRTADPSTLIKWELNETLKTQTKQEYARMLERYKQFGQLTPFLVMPDGVILGGNHGLDAVKELGLQAKCVDVDVTQEGDEYFFKNEGEVLRHVSYKSRDEALFKVAAAHNERFSQYDAGGVANFIGNYDIDVKDFIFDFQVPKTLGEQLDKLGEGILPPATATPITTGAKEVICPHCSKSFIPSV